MRLHQDLKKLIESSGISQSTIAKSTGMSASVISQYLKGSYPGNIAALEERIREFLTTHREREEENMPTTQEVVEIQSLKEIFSQLRRASRYRDIGMATGESGIGKTTALKEYHRRNPTTILIEADPGYTARSLAVELCEALGLDTRGNLHLMMKRIIAKLSGSGRLVIIDEAEHLPYRCLELIRRIHDKADIGVALVGMPRLKTNLQGDPNYFAQLYRRVGSHRPLKPLTDSDIASLISSRIGPVGSDVQTALRKACQSNARTLVKILRQCVEIARINSCDLTVDVVSRAEDLVVIA
ncbi:MAG TPA: AAA family ATPase [Fibrobacteria bacterium]|nr:AAA family ATPase [Fibrobacteria bacterium]